MGREEKLRVKSIFRYLFKLLSHTYLRILSPFKWYRLSKKSEIKLELGSRVKGKGNGFTTIDLTDADICHNLLKGIPLKSNTVAGIYSSHFFEHFYFKDLLFILSECYRVIAPAGFFSICVPNAGKYIHAYSKRSRFRGDEYLYAPAIVDTGSYLDQVNYVAYLNGQHKYMFDEENLLNLLAKVGFSKATLRKFDSTIDLLEREYESIYAVGFK